ncbi:MAG: S8 family serine peptidase, partial [Elusimicrobiota bacterium]
LVAKPEAVSMAAAELARMSPVEARSLGGAWMDLILGRRTHASNTAVVPTARSFGLTRSGLSASQAKDKKGQGLEVFDMPDYGREDEGADSAADFSNTDELGNQRRRTTPGPDDKDDGKKKRTTGGKGSVPGLLALGLSPFVAAALPGLTIGTAVLGFLAIVLPALVLHEMSHAWLADKLGDPNPRLAGRLSFSPRNLLNHISKPLEFNLFRQRVSIPFGWSVVMPVAMIVVSMLTLGFPIFFGGARPVEPTPRNLAAPAKGRSAIKGMAMVAMTGPLTHFALAAALGLAHTGLMAAGLATALLPALAVGVWLNVLFGIFNALPIFPLDGHHVMRWIVAEVLGKPAAARAMYGDPVSDTISRSARAWNMYALMGTFIVGFGLVLLPLTNILTGFFLTGSSMLAASGVQTAAAVLPFVGAVGVLVGHLRGRGKNEEDNGGRIGLNPPAGADPNAVSWIPNEEMPESKLFIVRFPESASEKAIKRDVHLSLIDLRGRGAIGRLAAARDSISVELNSVKTGMIGLLAAHNAQPIATYKLINAATIQVPEGQEASLRSALEAQGFLTYDNAERRIVVPIEDDEEIGDEFKRQDAEIGGAVTMDETLKISTADKVQEEARKRWGSPGMGWRRSLLAALLSVINVVVPQPAIAIMDTGVEQDHRLIQPYLKAAKDVRPDGDGADDNGHGSWVTSMVANYSRWTNNITHYKAFINGGATLDDVLKGLTMAANDGNIIMSNSWGSGDGNPGSPDSLMVKEMADKKGMIIVQAAGNSGYYGKNSIGSPAIIHHRAPNGAPRVIAVAATKRDKRRAGFSSRGEGSRVTSRGDEYKDYPRKPDAAEQGNNTEGAWLGGRLRAISGTSMSTPKFAGTLALLAMLFGVTKAGEELDRIVKAVFDTLTNEHDQNEIDIGDGFSAAWAAYQTLSAQGFAPVKRGWLQRFLVWLLDPGFERIGPPNPRPNPKPRPGSDSEGA